MFAAIARAAAVLALVATPAVAETIANPVASFSGLDKITGRITRFDVYVNETVLFGYAESGSPDDHQVLAGALVLTPRACYTRPNTETQRTSVFLEVDRVGEDGKTTRIFSGWMFADSPSLNAIDDPVYDVWLVNCKQSTDVPLLKQSQPAEPAPQAAPSGTQAQMLDNRG